MPNNRKFIVLPEREDMLQRLTSVMDEPHMIEQFYPLILNKAAGQEITGPGVIIIGEAILGYTDDHFAEFTFLRSIYLINSIIRP